jgi:hypothetical protein
VFPPKATIAAQLSKLTGWDAPTKVELEAGEHLTSFLGRLFAAGGTVASGGNGERQPSELENGEALAKRR